MREDHRARPPLHSPSTSHPAVPASAAAVRRVVEDALTGRVQPAMLADVVLLASELASNAILHTTEPFGFRVGFDGRTATLEVVDHGTDGLPGVRVPPTDQTSGRGLWLVDQLATRWGCTPIDGGKRVWCEIDVRQR